MHIILIRCYKWKKKIIVIVLKIEMDNLFCNIYKFGIKKCSTVQYNNYQVY